MDISTFIDTNRSSLKTVGYVSVGAIVGFGIGYILGKRSGDVFEISDSALTEMPNTTLYDDEVMPTSADNAVSKEYVDGNVTLETFDDDETDDDDNTSDINEENVNDTTSEPVYQGDYISPKVVETTSEPLRVNVFTNADNWDYELEQTNRQGTEPYVLHQDEFISDEMGYRQDTVTYYAGDDIMTDSHDTPIYNHKVLFGELKFGHGSNDKNVVYIRNEGMEMEWEVLLHTGSYSHEVMGLAFETQSDELRHSVQKFRRE